MFHIEDVLQIKDDEQVKVVMRRHISTLIPSLFLALILIVAPFFLLFPLFSWGIFGVILFFASVLLGIGIAIRTLLMWDADVFILSDFRIVDVDQYGLLARTVSEAALSSVQDVSWARKGLIESIFGIGSVTVQTAGATTTISAKKIKHPEEIYALINELRHVKKEISEPATKTNREEIIKIISKMIENYSTEELIRIEKALKARERSSVADVFLKNEEK